MTPFSPAYDNKIAKKYSAKTLPQKLENKVKLQKKLSWKHTKDQMMMCVPQGVTSSNGNNLLLEILPGLLALDIQLLIVGKGDRSTAEKISAIAADKADVIHIVPDEEIALRTMYAAADASIFLDDCSDSEELAHALDYACVPIATNCKELQNYNAIQESGNSFTIKELTLWHTFAAVVRSKETFQFPYDYRTIQRNCMAK